MSHKLAWQIEIETAIKARDYASAQRQIDVVLDADPGNKEARILQEEVLVRRTQEDEKSPVIFQGGMAQFAFFVLGAGLCFQPIVTIIIVLYNVFMLHHAGSLSMGASPAGTLGPIGHYSPWAIILSSLVGACVGLWLMKTAFDSWKNS